MTIIDAPFPFRTFFEL